MICLIASNNIQGHYADLLLRVGTKDTQVNSHFPRKFNFGEVGEYLGENDTVLIVVGFGYKKSENRALIESLERSNFYNMPFTAMYHYASWGDVIEADNTISSTVDEVISPIKLMKTQLSSIKSGLGKLTENGMFMQGLVKDIEAYHNYSFTNLPSTFSLELKLLGDVYRGSTGAVLANQLESEDEPTVRVLINKNADTLRIEQGKMEDYIQYKIGTAKVNTVGQYVLVMLYAEEYTNELAHQFLDNFKQAGYDKVIVMIGKHTKGDDMFNIRVSEGLDAAEIARKLNNGKGKAHAATVFLSQPLEALLKVTSQQLLTFL